MIAAELRVKFRFRLGIICAAASTVLLIFITCCFIGLWDQVAAITIFPQWSWALLGIVLGYAATRLSRKRWLLILPAIWCVTIVLFSDNLVSLFRTINPAFGEKRVDASKRIRVVTLNCAGSAAAAAEITDLKPDIVLLQEIPSTNNLADCVRTWFGDGGTFVSGFDCAILTWGTIKVSENDKFPPQFIRAQIETRNGKRVSVTSLRLIPPEGRLDLWNPKAWKASTENRQLRRRQLEFALADSSNGSAQAEIIGGDFNAPVSDSVFRLLVGFQDAHQEAGVGWGNTAVNSFPIARPDQIWIKGFRVIVTRSIRTKHSDHRLVVTDLEASD